MPDHARLRILPHYWRPPSNEVGVVIGKDQHGMPLLIEVLRYVHGVSNEELQDPVYTVNLGAIQVRLPGPVALLQAKIANVADLSQTGRQDVRHVLILAKLMPAYLQDLQDAALDGSLNERQLLKILERLLNVVTQAQAREVLAQVHVPVRALFTELGHKKLKKLQAFIDKRLPHVLQRAIE